MKENLRKGNGITLIALVITIIVLIILAGVSISLVLGENGIITKAKEAKQETLNAQVAEQEQLNEAVEYLENMGGAQTDEPEEDDDGNGGLEAGLYETGTRKMLKNWDELKSEELINVSDVTITSADSAISGDLVISNEITKIGGNSFFYCTSLTNVTIPNSVTSIEGYAFYHCTGLTEIIIPESVNSIGSQAFEWCENLTNITIPSTITNIEYATFLSCTSLKSVIIPSNVTSIGSSAFERCESLTSVTIDSETIVSSITSSSSNGNLVSYATTIYIRADILESSIGGYITSNYTKETESDKIGYVKYTKK